MFSFFHTQYLKSVVCGIVSAVCDVVAPWCLVRGIDDGLLVGDTAALWTWLGVMAAVQISGGFVRYRGRCSIAHASAGAECRRLDRFFARYLHADIREISDLSCGNTVAQVMNTATAERTFIESFYGQMPGIAVSLLGMASVLFWLSPVLALIGLATLPLSGLLWFWLRRRLRVASQASYAARESVYRHMSDALRMMIPIRTMHRTDAFEAQFQGATRENACAYDRLQRVSAVQMPFFDSAQAVAMLILFGAGGYGVISGSVSVGVLLGFQVYLSRLFGVMRSCTGLFGMYQRYVESCRRAAHIDALAQAQEVAFDIAAFPNVLCVEHLSFAFGEREIWHDVTFCIRAGEKRAILSSSGQGKTTLARCILGLYPLNAGRIALPDGKVERVGFVPQENHLFNAGIRDNFTLNGAPLSDEAFHHLLEICCLEAVYQRHGDADIGESGMKLSGGEQRRVMLGRALANAPDLLIIDQMGSELEPELCREIFRRMQTAYPNLGILYLGHRMPECDNMSEINL